jgi:hypothetical protein
VPIWIMMDANMSQPVRYPSSRATMPMSPPTKVSSLESGPQIDQTVFTLPSFM